MGRWYLMILNSVLVYNVNNNGPRQEPWGTPHSYLTGLDCDSLIFIHWVLPEEHDANQKRAFELKTLLKKSEIKQGLVHTVLRRSVCFSYANLKPRYTIATCQRNISYRCWAQHVAHVWPPCSFENAQIWANNSKHVATRRNTVAKRAQHVAPKQCSDMLRSFGPSLIMCLVR